MKLDSTIQFLSKVPGLKKAFRYFFRKENSELEKKIINELSLLNDANLPSERIKQDERLLLLINHAAKNCEYYKKLFSVNSISTNSLNDFSKIPLLTKEMIRKNSQAIIAKNSKTIELRKSNTGGSTGEPLEFYTDKYSIIADNAHHKFLYNLMGYQQEDLIIDNGSITISEKKRNQNIYWIKYPKGSIWGHYGFSALYLNKNNIDLYINKLVELKPAIIRGYPSFVNELAIYLLENKIYLNFKIKGINLTAEFCSDIQKKNIEEAFSTKIFFEYGQGEKTVFCWTDGQSDDYRSSPLYGYVEVINDNGLPAEINEEGEIIVTSLINFSMPFIRYRTGDRGILSYRNGGIVKFKKIMGRTQDFIIDKQKNKIFLTALIFGQHFKAFKNIKQWQIIQNYIGEIDLNIIKSDSFNSEDEEEIKQKLQSAANIKININFVNEVHITQSGKKPFLIQNLKHNFL